jgi:hypothetical protein
MKSKNSSLSRILACLPELQAPFCCPTRARTWTRLIQSQLCYQLHHRTAFRLQKYKKNDQKNHSWNF